MSDTIPRKLVADAFGVAEEVLPEGDLPLARFAEIYLNYIRAGDEDSTPVDHPDQWAFALMCELIETAPGLAFAATRATLRLCDSAEDIAVIAAGPLEDLIADHGVELIGDIEALASTAPRFAYALTGVWPREQQGGLLWARIEAARRGAGELDAGDPLPGPDGL
jgi:hypothetical protein